jgi:6-phosphogluconate dehydrogenase
MRIGMIGLGKMGANMSRRLLNDGHDIVGFDLDPDAIAAVEEDGADGATDLDALVDQLHTPRVCWMMVPAGDAVDATLDDLLPRLHDGDIVVDGGNSNYKDTLRRAGRAEEHGVHYVDVGTSGGVWGLREGYSMMVGGPDEAVGHLRPALETLAPGPDKGWGHMGEVGAGHFVKMVHNGIEYGVMQAYDSGEGRWTVKEAIDLDVPAPVITDALISRLDSRVENSYTHKLLAAMRNQFGGHDVKESDE